MQQSGGFIEVDSRRGQGTTITLYLPRCDARPRSLPAAKPPDESLCGSETILLVEDDEAVRKMTQQRLEAWGNRVITARHGAATLEL